MKTYKKTYGKKEGIIKFPFLTFKNDQYSNLMTYIMHSLEKRRILKGEIIAKELEECGEVLFVMEGRYNVGYEINKIVRFRK